MKETGLPFQSNLMPSIRKTTTAKRKTKWRNQKVPNNRAKSMEENSNSART
jgi:hypothetical protein